jgi:hypothetical protein
VPSSALIKEEEEEEEEERIKEHKRAACKRAMAVFLLTF